jgi:hypothetical protein
MHISPPMRRALIESVFLLPRNRYHARFAHTVTIEDPMATRYSNRGRSGDYQYSHQSKASITPRFHFPTAQRCSYNTATLYSSPTIGANRASTLESRERVNAGWRREDCSWFVLLRLVCVGPRMQYSGQHSIGRLSRRCGCELDLLNRFAGPVSHCSVLV